MNVGKAVGLVLVFILAVVFYVQIAQTAQDAKTKTIEYKTYDEVSGEWVTHNTTVESATEQNTNAGLMWMLVLIIAGVGFGAIIYDKMSGGG